MTISGKQRRSLAWGTAAMWLALAGGCGGGQQPASESLRATIGAQGGQLVGAKGSALDGVKVVIPAGALGADTAIEVRPASSTVALPATAVRCGAEFELLPAGLQLAVPAQVTLPFDETVVTQSQRFDDEVKVWVQQGDHFTQEKQLDSAEGSVTVELSALSTVAAGVNPPAPADVIHFDLHANPKFLSCLAAYPTDPDRQPTAEVTVVRGELNDALFLHARNIKPGLKFDLFSVEHSPLGADDKPDPAFVNFGLAWYQSDVDANGRGSASVLIRTILLDQIFGFDPTVGLAPTNTFHVGFWFNNPADAAPCGFDPTKPTPFNGEHDAGPLAMISLPDATTGLGPLCTHPDTSVTPARCSP
jgi:hypothetical protein